MCERERLGDKKSEGEGELGRETKRQGNQAREIAMSVCERERERDWGILGEREDGGYLRGERN